MNTVIEEISKIGIVPVIALDDAKDAEPLAKVLNNPEMTALLTSFMKTMK